MIIIICILTAKKYLGPMANSLMNDSNAKTMVKKILPLYRREFMYGDLLNRIQNESVSNFALNDKVKSDLRQRLTCRRTPRCTDRDS